MARLALLDLRRGRAGLALLGVVVALLALLGLAADRGLAVSRSPGAGSLDFVVVGSTLLGTAAFVALLLGAIVAVFLGQSAVRGDAQSGMLQPVLARPVHRGAVVAGRLLAAAGVAAATTALIWASAVVVVGLAGGYWPRAWVVPVGQLALAGALVAVLAVAASTVLAATAAGIATLSLVGVGFTVGLVGQLGLAFGLPELGRVADVVSVLLPFEALYRAVLAGLGGELVDLARFGVASGPFGGARTLSTPMAAGIAGWTVLMLALTVHGTRRLDA